MSIYYKVYRDGVWYTSPKRNIYVGPSLASLPPFINEVSDNRLDPDKIADSINVHIPSAGTLVKDKITLFWSDSSKQKTFTDEGLLPSRMSMATCHLMCIWITPLNSTEARL